MKSQKKDSTVPVNTPEIPQSDSVMTEATVEIKGGDQVAAEATNEVEIVETKEAIVGGAKPKKQKKETKKAVEASVEVDNIEVKPTKAKTEKKAAPKAEGKTVKKVQPKKSEVTEEAKVAEDDVDALDSRTRSFKVQLPGETDFAGRFTGLTPYQAANKALSKYFRNLENANLSDQIQVEFSIRESTRGSKRLTYVYKGNRIKLAIPITYSIKSQTGEDRVITKQYKNQLIKVKKSINKQQPVATA